MSQTRCPSADELAARHSPTDRQAAHAARGGGERPPGSVSTVEMLEQLQAELADFLVETKVRLERACERAPEGSGPHEGSAQQPSPRAPAELPAPQPARQLADESFDRLQEIKRRLAAQLQQQ